MGELMEIEKEEIDFEDNRKVKGLSQVGEDYLLSMAFQKLALWGGIWKTVKAIDKDSNGFVLIEELEEIFKE